ncbi:MAG: phosphoenolpyruvate carboxykinase [Chloroflexi bacterium]|nr:phosphoenolpyruvate carboxykinase [Chloroflexota bacterium]
MGDLLRDPLQVPNLWRDLAPQELRVLASKDEIPNRLGVAVYHSRIRSRSARFTYVVQRPEEAAVIEQVRDYLKSTTVLQVDRDICQNPANIFRVRYAVTRPYARLAYMMSRNLSAPRDSRDPDILVVQVPEWPDLGIYVHPAPDGRVYTYVLGSDYYGEAKMGSLRAAMHIMRERRGGLGLHAASKVYRLATAAGMAERGALIFGLSGTGKTTISVNGHGLEPPEGITLLQDDIVMLTPSAYGYGTEEAFYVKTDSITEQPGLLEATKVPTAVLENTWVEEDGSIDFTNWTLTSNGRAIVPRWAIPHTGGDLDLPKVDLVFFNTRRYDLPPVGRLASPAQAAAFLMLGESTITSADDPNRVGESMRVVAFDPFILGDFHKQGNFFYQLLKANPDIRVYLLNTGKMGGMDDGVKITPEVTMRTVEAVVRGQVSWQYDPILGYDTATDIPGVDLNQYDPYRIYGKDRFAALMGALRRERQAWLDQFPELHADIRNALKE